MKITKEHLKQVVKEEILKVFKENNDWYDDEHETFADLKSDPKLHQSFDDDPDALSQLAGDNSSLAWHAKLEDRLQKQLERGEITRQDYDDILKAAAGPKNRVLKKALGLMQEASEKETAGTRKASEQEIKTLVDNTSDTSQFEPGSRVQTSFVEDALNITIIGRFRNEIYVQPGRNRGYHSGKPIYILGKLL
mgnify:CR=1 FL=1